MFSIITVACSSVLCRWWLIISWREKKYKSITYFIVWTICCFVISLISLWSCWSWNKLKADSMWLASSSLRNETPCIFDSMFSVSVSVYISLYPSHQKRKSNQITKSLIYIYIYTYIYIQLTYLHEWLQVSLGASFIWPCAIHVLWWKQ